MPQFKEKKCKPCEGGVPKYGADVINELLNDEELTGWEYADDKIYKTFKFKNFVQAIQFINQMADIAESEGHHPDFCVHYNKVDVTLWTHAINGLSENDFILASKINALFV